MESAVILRFPFLDLAAVVFIVHGSLGHLDQRLHSEQFLLGDMRYFLWGADLHFLTDVRVLQIRLSVILRSHNLAISSFEATRADSGPWSLDSHVFIGLGCRGGS